MFILIRKLSNLGRVFVKLNIRYRSNLVKPFTPDGETGITVDVATCSLRYRSIFQQHEHSREASILEANL